MRIKFMFFSITILILGLITGITLGETFSASFPEGCIGCIDSITKSDSIIQTIPLPQGELELTIDTKVLPRRTLGIVCGPGDFFFRGWDKVYPETWHRAPGEIIEKTGTPKSEGDPEGVCGIEGQQHLVHMVTHLKLSEPILLEIAMDPSVEYHGGGPAWQYAQQKEITISYSIIGDSKTKTEPTRTGIGSDDCSISRTYSTNQGTLTLVQVGQDAFGTYTHDDGQISGTLIGKTFQGSWSEGPDYAPPNDAGECEFIFSDDCTSFTGHWRYGFTNEWGPSAQWSGSWSGSEKP